MGLDVEFAARKRIAEAFNNFEKVCVSFSAGKDSTTMLHLVMQEAIKRDRRVGVLLIDLEAQYECTIDCALQMFKTYRSHIDPYWVALPIHLRNAVSVFEPFWKCWDQRKKEFWVRKPPKIAITSRKYFPFFQDGMEFEEFVPEFAEWYSDGVATAFFVGIRTQESYSRYLSVASEAKVTFQGSCYTTGVCENSDSFNYYPLYDWKTEDIWRFHARHKKLKYNKLYDLMYLAGVPLANQRICQPYGDDQKRGLWLFHLIEPKTWCKVVARVNGANYGSLFTKEHGNVNGYRQVIKPNHLTWREFACLLVSSMPNPSRDHYADKICIFAKCWETRGYPAGIPDEGPFELEAAKRIPSWRRICKTLLQNDYWCRNLGFTQEKSNVYKDYLSSKRQAKKKAPTSGAH
tara:strand:+ start:4307 stop:5518 length:1212 start_codon:yes stop_codon:yes gene_type:complete